MKPAPSPLPPSGSTTRNRRSRRSSRRLERQLGTTLVDRGIRPLRLTEAGSALAQRAAAAFEQITAAELEVEAIANLSAGRLRVGTFSSAGASIVVDALRAFRRDHPDVDISITEIGMPSALTRSLRRGDIDVGVSFDYPEIGDTFADDLAQVPLLDDPFDVVVPRGHTLERAQTIASPTWPARSGCSETSAPTARASA